MSYIGIQPTAGSYRKLTDISGGFNGSTTTFQLSVPPGTSAYYVTPLSTYQLLISVNNVLKNPGVDYTLNGSQIVFTTPPAAGVNFFGVVMGDAVSIGAPAAGTVTSSSLTNDLTVVFNAGSVTTPSITTTGNLNNGIYFPATNNVAVTTNGVQRVLFDASGNTNIIGSLKLSGSTSGYNGFKAAAVAGSTIWTLPTADGTANQILKTDGSGNLGWVTASSGIFGAGSATAASVAVGTGTTYSPGLYSPGTDQLAITTSGTGRLFVDASGNIHLGGSTSALANLNIYGTSGQGGGIQINRNTSGSPTSGQSLGSVAFKGTASANNNTTGEALIEAVAAETFTGSTAATHLLFYTKPTGTGPGSSPQERCRIDSTGKLLVGTSSSSGSSLLQVQGTISDTAGNIRSIPQNSQTTGYTLVATDNGKHISITTGGVTVPSAVFSIGDVVSIFNNSGSNQTITQGTSVTLRQGGTANTGNRTLAQYGVATVLCVASNTFVITGAGLS